MKKIAFINQRYGLEVNGGSEYYTRLMAEKMTAFYEVDILTTKAVSYDMWEDCYENETDFLNSVTIRRFHVNKKRRNTIQKGIGKLLKITKGKGKVLGEVWVRAQGPCSDSLIRFIKLNKDNYDVFIFVTYLYYLTVKGMPKVADKSVFIPTAHDEYCIYFSVYRPLFYMPKAIIYLTQEEKDFVERLFPNQNVANSVIGVGADIPQNVDRIRFRHKFGIKDDFIIYVGRVDESKGCPEMIDFFSRYVKETDSRLKLVMIGQAYMELPQSENIYYLGFLSESDKFDAIKGAVALWLPSQYESLSIAVLEAMAMAVPVIVNGKSDVLKGHCDKSGGGVYYNDYTSFLSSVQMITGRNRSSMGRKAREYYKQNYNWDRIIDSFKIIVEGTYNEHI